MTASLSVPHPASKTHKTPPDTRLLANAIRALAMDAVQAANSGHPGMPMGMAEIAVALWNRHLRHNPANPHWPDRDRFVLSNGHGSMLQYALLHLTGYALPLDELKHFRQLGSATPGHPELGVTPGVETTTGPLGQGLANAVGMALAERLLATEFNRPGHTIVDHRTYVFAGDGCMMEGISHEACSLAGTLGLSKLVCFYDDNGISIDGKVAGWFTDDTPARFAAYGWHVVPDVDGHDVDAVDAAIRSAHATTDRPTLICCKTIIGRGSPNRAGTDLAHGAGAGRKGSRADAGGDRLELSAVRDSAGRLRRLERARVRRIARVGLEHALCRVRGRAIPRSPPNSGAAFPATSRRISPRTPPRSRPARTTRPSRSRRARPRSRRSRPSRRCCRK